MHEPPRSFTSGMLLPELVSTRGTAAVWVVLAHTLATVLKGQGELPAPVEYTRLVVDFFFVLSGFVLAHMYDPPWRDGRFRHGAFLIRRLARLWPLHMFTLCAMGAVVIVGRMMGAEPENPHTAYTFLVNAAMLHSTWLAPDLAWNWPSWSISAEWCAYLAIPLFLVAADRVRGTRLRVFAMLALFLACSLVSHWAFGLDLTSLTADGGALRIAPSFFAGILLRRIFDDEPWLVAMTPRVYAASIAGVFGVCAVLIAFNAPYDALWPPMIVLVAALASRATWVEPGLLRGRVLNWLGDISYSIYLTHAIVLTVLFNSAEILGVADTLGERVALGLAVPFATLAASQITYAWVEKPGRKLVMRIAERGERKALRPAGAE